MNETQTITATDGGKTHEIIPGLVSIIIPIYLKDYSLFHYTGNCIGSVREHTYSTKTPFEIVVVDNGSPIQHKTPVEYKVDKYIRNEENLGVTKAWNQGVRIAQGEYICLLNNDTMVFDGWLEDLKGCLTQLDLVMATPMYGEAWARAVESKKKRLDWLSKPVEDSFSDFRDFSCVLAKRSLFDEVGVFDEEYLTYAQDTDFLTRLHQYGKKFASTKRVAIHHVIGATSMSMEETPGIMDQDKETYHKKWSESKPEVIEEYNHPNPSPDVLDIPSETPVTKEVVRTEQTGDRAYLLRDGKLHWITSPKALETLGYGFGDIVSISQEEYAKLMLGEPINEFNVDEYKK